MDKKRFVWRIAGILLLCGAILLAGFAILTVNRKINTLAGTVAQQMETISAQDAKLASLSEEIVALEEAVSRNTPLPSLAAGEDAWVVTQFGDPEGAQEMCYAITGRDGLILIDGGFEYEEATLRKVIASCGNRVSAWFLTHPHPDHVTAFMDIYEDPQGIVIEKVYAPKMPDVAYMRERASWDDFSAAERFAAMTIPELSYLHEGDALQVLGLSVDVLNAYGEAVDAVSKDLLNDGSLMLRFAGKEESFLFCADVGKAMTGHLVETYGKALKSDYVQMGHHGFGGPDEEFYRLVAPKAAFFDAPNWLVSGPDERSTRQKAALMTELGAVQYFFSTAPNQVTLR